MRIECWSLGGEALSVLKGFSGAGGEEADGRLMLGSKGGVGAEARFG